MSNEVRIYRIHIFYSFTSINIYCLPWGTWKVLLLIVDVIDVSSVERQRRFVKMRAIVCILLEM